MIVVMWQVSYLAAAELELEGLPPAEQVAIRHAVEKLQLLGIRLPAPHCKPVQGVIGAWWELRPRRGNSPWRPLYIRTSREEFVIGAVAPDGETHRREFRQAGQLAAERVTVWEKQEGMGQR